MKYSNETRTRCKSLSWVEIEREKSRIHIQQLYLQRRNNLMRSHDDISALQVSIQEQKIKEINPTKKKQTHKITFLSSKNLVPFSVNPPYYLCVTRFQIYSTSPHEITTRFYKNSKIPRYDRRVVCSQIRWAEDIGVGWRGTIGIRTVDGQNPAPPRRMIIPLFIGFQPSQMVQDFFHQQYFRYFLWMDWIHR